MLTKKHEKVFSRRDVELPPIWQKKNYNGSVDNTERFNEIFASGKKRALAGELVNILNNAEQMVLVCSFLLADKNLEEAIYRAARRGVRIYLMLACETRLKNTPDDDFGKQCLEQHLKMLKRLGGLVLIRSAPHYHAKLVIADPFEEDRHGLLLTANLTSEALERNEEVAVRLTGNEIEELIPMLRWAIFENAEHEMLDSSNFTSVNPLGEIHHPNNGKHVISTTMKSSSIKERLLQVISDAGNELILSSFGWQEEHLVTDALCSRAKDGLKITVFARIRPASMPALLKLRNAGVRVLGFKWLHAKAVISDHQEAVVMSANLQDHGLENGFEVGIVFNDSRVNDLARCFKAWEESAQWELLVNQKLGDINGDVKLWHVGKLEDITVDKKQIVALDDITADSAEDLDMEAELPEINWQNYPAHEIVFQWDVKAPVLNTKSEAIYRKEKRGLPEKTDSAQVKNKKNKPKKKFEIIKTPYKPAVFRESTGRTVIAIADETEMAQALSLRAKAFRGAAIVLRKEEGVQ